MKTKILINALILGLGLLLAGNTSFASDRFQLRQKGYYDGKPSKNLHVDPRKRSVKIHKKGYYEVRRHGGYYDRGYHDDRFTYRGSPKWRRHPQKHPPRGYHYGKRYPGGHYGYPFNYRCNPGWVFGFSFGGFF